MSLIKVRRIATLNGEDKRDGKDSIAADTKDSARNVKYRGCEITVAYHNPDNVNLSGKTWIVKDVDGVSVGGFSSEAKAKAWIDAHPSRTADSRATDACGTDAKFKKGDKVKLSGSHPRFPNRVAVVTHVFPTGFVKVKVDGIEDIEIAERLISKAEDAAEFHVGQRVRAKDPRWTGYQGHALGNGIYTVKKVDSDGTVKLDGFLDVWISPSALVEANDACGKGEDAKNDFANRIMPLVRKIADAQKIIEGVLGEAEDIGFEAAHGEFPDSTFAKKSANQLEAACYEAVTALRKVKMINIL